MDQRLVGLAYTSGAGSLNVTAPPNGNIAPPGYYMLFMLNSAGVPSVASFIRLSPKPPNQIPTAAIIAPLTDVTVAVGGSVSFAGTGNDSDGTINSYAWTFPGGNPSSSSSANPGSVTYANPGTYVASFKVTDNAGGVSQAATRTITVPDFSMTATPSSQSVTAGGGTSYDATVTAGTGFSGIVNFSVTGLPAGVTASFNPTSVTNSGSTTMSISTSASTALGSYTLTIRATSGTVTHTSNVTLVVASDFSITVTPSSVSISKGGDARYTVTISAGPGFSGAVKLTTSGLPRQSSDQFSPATINNAGTSVLTISTKKNVAPGTNTITVTGTSGTRVHSTTVALVVQ
jgi:PKD repeat protein